MRIVTSFLDFLFQKCHLPTQTITLLLRLPKPMPEAEPGVLATNEDDTWDPRNPVTNPCTIPSSYVTNPGISEPFVSGSTPKKSCNPSAFVSRPLRHSLYVRGTVLALLPSRHAPRPERLCLGRPSVLALDASRDGRVERCTRSNAAPARHGP